jgi:hypothetical protein
MKDAKLLWSTYDAITRNNGTYGTSGINWSYAKFPTQADMNEFISECNAHDFRTRNSHEHDGFFVVQYHHYAD